MDALPPPFADTLPPPFAVAVVAKPIPKAASQWDWQGVDSPYMSTAGMRQHLMNEHGYSVGYLAGLSRAELIKLHNRDHDAKKAAKIVPLAPASSCPGGVCPIPSAPPRLFGRWR